MPRGSTARGGKAASGARPRPRPSDEAGADRDSRRAGAGASAGVSRSGDGNADADAAEVESDGGHQEDGAAKIPDELLTRILHEAFRKKDTRMSKAANRAVGRYFEIFVQEAIARTAQERDGRFLEVEDLEKITPQLIMDL